MGPLSLENAPTTIIKRAAEKFTPQLYGTYIAANSFYNNIPKPPNNGVAENIPKVTSKNTLQKFKSIVLSKNIVRTNQFYVTIPMPTNLQSMYGVDEEAVLQFSCYKADIPGMEINTSDVRTTGPSYKVPYNISYPIMSLEFYCIGDMEQKRIFDNWKESIQDPIDYQMHYSSDYFVDLHIEAYINTIDTSTDNYTKLYGVIVRNAYPLTIDTLTNDWEENNQIRRLRIGFAYKDWRRDDLNPEKNTSIVRPIGI